MAKKQQLKPQPKRGYEFIGWATFNWGICHQNVYRTRKEAMEACCDPWEKWSDVKDHFKVVKVKCVVL